MLKILDKFLCVVYSVYVGAFYHGVIMGLFDDEEPIVGTVEGVWGRADAWTDLMRLDQLFLGILGIVVTIATGAILVWVWGKHVHGGNC